MSTYYVYILANHYNDVLYIGMTNNLMRRVREHKSGIIKGYTWKYNVHKLVWYESTTSVDSAMTREKQLKKWNREWKERLINQNNPNWDDLYVL